MIKTLPFRVFNICGCEWERISSFLSFFISLCFSIMYMHAYDTCACIARWQWMACHPCRRGQRSRCSPTSSPGSEKWSGVFGVHPKWLNILKHFDWGFYLTKSKPLDEDFLLVNWHITKYSFDQSDIHCQIES